MSTEIMSKYDAQAAEFLTAHHLTLTLGPADAVDQWGALRNKYTVTIRRQGAHGARLQFPFYGSVNDFQAHTDPTAYDVLACLNNEAGIPDDLTEFFSEYGGDEDSIKETAQARKAIAFGRRLRAFFTEDELDALSTIQ